MIILGQKSIDDRQPKSTWKNQKGTGKEARKQSAATKLATTQIVAANEMSPSNPNRKSQRKIVAKTNVRFGTNISHKTVSRMVREGKIGVSPTKPGPVGRFNKTECDAMKIAFLSFIKLEQAIGKKQSTIRELGFCVNVMVNYLGRAHRRGDDLAKRLKKDVADDINVKKPNQQELRRVLWTPCGNLKVWFDQWEHTATSLGFGRLKLPDEDHLEDASVIFFPGQKKRIVNLDKTIGCIVDDRQMPSATRTCLTNTPRDAEPILDFEVILQFRSRLISLFL